jgi:uncharacterized membrane-anchored protein
VPERWRSVYRRKLNTKKKIVVLEKEELNKIIEKIESENSKEKAFFGIHYVDAGDELFIKANKYGLELFANELLKASRNADEIIQNSEKNILTFDPKEKWITSDIWLAYIEPKADNRIDINEKPYKKKWKDKIFEYGCLAIIGIGIIVFIAGIFAVISWFR